MRKLSILAFMASGFSIGIITVAMGRSFPVVMAVGAGPLFFVGVLTALVLTRPLPTIKIGLWRYIVALLLSCLGYVLVVFIFSVVTGYSSDIFGVKASNDITDFGGDVLYGLLAATIGASVVIEGLVSVMTAKWSYKMLVMLIFVGIISVLLTYLLRGLFLQMAHTSTPELRYWSFFGVLFSLGEALLAGAVGMQVGAGIQSKMIVRRS